MTQSALTKLAERLSSGSPTIEPNHKRMVQTVRKVVQAMTAELNVIVMTLRLKLKDEQKASAAAKRTAASPPYSSMVRKMSVSETEIWELRRGIGIERRDPNPSVITANNTKRRSKPTKETRYAEAPKAAAPREIMSHI